MRRRIIHRRPIRRRENFGQTGKTPDTCNCPGKVCSNGQAWNCQTGTPTPKCMQTIYNSCAELQNKEGFGNVRRPRRRFREGFGQTAPSSSCCPCGPGGGGMGGRGGRGGRGGGMGGRGMRGREGFGNVRSPRRRFREGFGQVPCMKLKEEEGCDGCRQQPGGPEMVQCDAACGSCCDGRDTYCSTNCTTNSCVPLSSALVPI